MMGVIEMWFLCIRHRRYLDFETSINRQMNELLLNNVKTTSKTITLENSSTIYSWLYLFVFGFKHYPIIIREWFAMVDDTA